MRSFSQATRFRPCSFGEDYPLPTVDEFTCRVEVTGVGCRLSDYMQQDFAQVVEPPAAKQVLRPTHRCAVQGRGGNDGIGKFYLPPVGVQRRGGRRVRRDLPGVIRLVVWHRLASNNGTEPEPLDVDRQMVYQPCAGPVRGQYGAPQVLLGKALQDAEHVMALIGEGWNKRLALLGHGMLRHGSSTSSQDRHTRRFQSLSRAVAPSAWSAAESHSDCKAVPATCPTGGAIAGSHGLSRTTCQ